MLYVIPKSEEWTSELRKNFLRGSESFLSFLLDIEGMDEIRRQNEDHQIMEGEWETAFNIFIHMQESFSLLLEWAKTDVILLI